MRKVAAVLAAAAAIALAGCAAKGVQYKVLTDVGEITGDGTTTSGTLVIDLRGKLMNNPTPRRYTLEK